MSQRSRPRSQPRPARRAVAQALRHAGLDHLIVQAEVMAAWPRVVGPVMARHTWPEVLREGELVIATDHPAWRQELHYRTAEVLQRLAEVLHRPVVKTLSTVVRARPASESSPDTTPPAADPASETFGRAAADPVADQALREAFARAAAAFARSRYRGRPGGTP